MDFLMVCKKTTNKQGIEIYPKFIINSASKDLMIRGSDFYAIWDPEKNLWSTDEQEVIRMVDAELDKYASEVKSKEDAPVKVLHMWDSDSGSIDKWHKYLQKQCRDNYHQLDAKIIFSNDEITKKDYCTKKLSYPLEKGTHEAYDELMDTLYSPEERKKIEWAIGSIVTGDSKVIQKFLVLYGSAGTGKSTVLNIIQQLFEGYYSVFDARALGSATNVFALEAFKTNPLIAIQHDGDLSKIEDNTRLNSIVSHELMTVNEKYKSTYQNRFDCFLFMGTNKPVKITDAKSGIIRRLIDVSPTGDKVSTSRYKAIMNKIKFELGAIAYHCMEVYENDKGAYDNYIPISMLGASNDFYNFVLDSYDTFKRDNSVTLKSAWSMYKDYCVDAAVPYPYSLRVFKEELKNYFRTFNDRARHGQDYVRNFYEGFLTKKFMNDVIDEDLVKAPVEWLQLDTNPSVFDDECRECPAQYTKEDGTPRFKWDNVTTKLSDLETFNLHYVKVPENHIVIDFDLKDENGNKSAEKNLEAASKFPRTYAEFSKSGAGVHLHYIYDGDVSKLSCLYDTHIEVKVFSGGSSLRRKLSKCNTEKIKHINSGLPLKTKGESMVDYKLVKNELVLRARIVRTMNKEYHAGTKPAVDFIYKLLNDAYASGMDYDVSDMRLAIETFAANSTHHAEYCMQLVDKMHFKSENMYDNLDNYDKEKDIIFYDVEVFPNLFIVCWKGLGAPVTNSIVNPTPEQIEELSRFKLVGFNNRKYDNHIMYARMQHYTIPQLYKLSHRIINAVKNQDRDCFFGQAYNLSYTDIYDFSSKKQGLKKFEIDLGIHHQELGLPWDKPVPEDRWEEVADYCKNDVVATEAVWNDRQADFLARQILADIAGMTVNDTTNQLTTRIIFGDDKHPQDKFRYRNLADPVPSIDHEMEQFLEHKTTVELGYDAQSVLPYFKGYEYDKAKRQSTYCDEVVGEGGYVFAQPGMYNRCKVYDVASMHPHSITSEYLFGVYTENFNDLMEARVLIKHGDYEKAGELFGGKLKKYLEDKSTAKALSGALKIAINSVYGLTAASFDHPFHDPRNIDNIVAKRGALFMITLKNAVLAKGYKVLHVKTDSIKVLNPDQNIEKFILNYGKKYGYQFEIENIFDRVCLVNDAVYIAKCDADDPESPGKWTATGTQFAVPYVFKTLFSKEPIEFRDLCETKTVQTALYLDMNEGLPSGEHNYIFIGRAGSFCPIKPGHGGGELLRDKGDGTYASATGCKGWRWLESEVVEKLGKQDDIDIDYYRKLVDDAKGTIGKYGNFDNFVAEGRYIPDFLNVPETDADGVPFDET